MKEISIAIDGPAGAGKSTIARRIAQHLDYTYIDTGAMYRAVTLKALRLGIDLLNEKELEEIAGKIQIILKSYTSSNDEYENRVVMDGEDITEEIRVPLISQNVSLAAKAPGVREHLVRLQRRMADTGGVVMDGRDIGTVVLPQAELKIFLTASIEERAKRRYLELIEKGYPVDLAALQEEIALRDRMDSEREFAPLMQASDAIVLDTTNLTILQVIERILQEYQRKRGGC